MTLKKRIFITFFPIFIFLISGSALSYISFIIYRNEQHQLYQENLILNQLLEQYNNVKKNYTKYLQSKRFEDLEEYLKESASLKEKTEDLGFINNGDETALLFEDILGMMNSYLEISDKAVVMKGNRLISEYYDEYLKSIEVDQFINKFIGLYNNALLQRNVERYRSLENRVSIIQRVFLFLLIFLSLTSLWLMNYLSRTVSEPVTDLTIMATQIAEGYYYTTEIKSTSVDELIELSRTFCIMSEKIMENIQLKDALHEEEMKNIKMRERSAKAEFSALQSQINPHFMFNTLNAGVQLAMFEQAEQTENYLNNFSSLLRYSFRNLREPVTITRELDSVKIYLALMRIRFGDIFTYKESITGDLVRWHIPRTIMQPIIENIFVHVLDSVEHLLIEISIRAVEDRLVVSVIDNGPGFQDEEMQKINAFSNYNFDELSEMTKDRIGLINVYFRLRLYCGKNFNMIAANNDAGGCLTLEFPSFSMETAE